MIRLCNSIDRMTKSPTGKETLNTRRPEGEVGGGRGDTSHACAKSLFLKLILLLFLILTTSNAEGDSNQHNSSASLTHIAEAVRTHRKEI